jgi:fermentation-respiration switch protein FrsA (DUF1100 family)
VSAPRRKHPIRNRVILYGLFLFIVLVVLPHRMLYPGNSVSLPETVATASSGLSVVSYETKDGVALRGALFRPSGPEALTVLYFHGNAQSAAACLPLGEYLASRGVQVFLAEYRGFGGCSGWSSEGGLYEDAEAAHELLRARGVKEDRLVIIGRSLGTGVAVEMARRGYGCGLLLVSPYTSITDVGRNRFGPLVHLAWLDAFDSLSKIGSVKVPVVAIHGTADTLIPMALGKRLVEAAPSGRLVPVEGCGHNDLDEEGLLERELRPWLSR